MSHTPGKWTIHEDQFTESIWIETPSLGCIVSGILGADRWQALANARLIAAAPDMLAALEALLADADRGDMSVIMQAKAAISKAKGL